MTQTTHWSNIDGLAAVLNEFGERLRSIEDTRTHVLGGPNVLVQQDSNRFVITTLDQEDSVGTAFGCSGLLDMWNGSGMCSGLCSGFKQKWENCSGLCSGFVDHFDDCVPCSGLISKMEGCSGFCDAVNECATGLTCSGLLTSIEGCTGFCDAVNDCVSGFNDLTCSGLLTTIDTCTGFCDAVNECVTGLTCTGLVESIEECDDVCSAIQEHCVPCDYINDCINTGFAGADFECSDLEDCCDGIKDCLDGTSNDITVNQVNDLGGGEFETQEKTLTFTNGLLTDESAWSNKDTFNVCDMITNASCDPAFITADTLDSAFLNTSVYTTLTADIGENTQAIGENTQALADLTDDPHGTIPMLTSRVDDLEESEHFHSGSGGS